MVLYHTSYTRKGWLRKYNQLESQNKRLLKRIDKTSQENIKLKEKIKFVKGRKDDE